MVLEEGKWLSGVSPEALLGASGRTFWVPGAIFFGPGSIFFGSVGYFGSMCMFVYQPVPTFINFYQLLHQLLSSFINLSELLAIVLHLFQFLMASTNLYRLV